MTEPALPARGVHPEWLALREPADTAARDVAADTLLPPLLRHLAAAPPDDGLRVVDLGAGTGANLRWLAPRLAELGAVAALPAQRWTLVDHDPRLHAWGPASATTVHADVTGLTRLLAERAGTDLVTAAALLDLLDQPRLDAVVDAAVAHGAPVLAALSVTGRVVLDPGEGLDVELAEAFDAHQRRDGRLGPDAGAVLDQAFRRHGWTVIEASTPWQLGQAQEQLLDAWLVGRAEAAVEWVPGLAAAAADWLERRRAQAHAGALDVVVDHVDLLALPPRC